FKQLRAALEKAGLTNDFKFSGLSYPSKQQTEEKAKNPEDEKLIRLPAWQTLRKLFQKHDLIDAWRIISSKALEGEPELLDKIAWILSVYKEDDEVKNELRKLELINKEKVIDALLDIRFDKFSNLSL